MHTALYRSQTPVPSRRRAESWSPPSCRRSGTYRPSAVGAHPAVGSHALAPVDHQHLVLNGDLVLAVDRMLQVSHTSEREGGKISYLHFPEDGLSHYQSHSVQKYLTNELQSKSFPPNSSKIYKLIVPATGFHNQQANHK